MNQFFIDTRKTGTGKTTNAINNLSRDLESRFGKQFKTTFLLTPYARTRKQILENHHDKTCELTDLIRDENKKNKVVVTTYAGLSLAIRESRIDITDCLLIFDELPTFIQFSTYQEQLSELLEYIVNPDLYGSITCYGLTGTPEILFEYFNNIARLPYKFVDDTPDEKELKLLAEKGLFIKHGSVQAYVHNLINRGLSGSKMIYVDSARTAVKTAQTFNEQGYTSAFIVSESNDTIDKSCGKYYSEMMNEQIFDGLPITTWIDERCDIPRDLDVLIVNASCRDGINILDRDNRIDEVIIQSADSMTIKQARARIRHNINQITIIFNEQNKKKYLESYSDCFDFLNDESHDLIDRFNQQQQSSIENQAWKDKKNHAIKNQTKFNEPEPARLDFIVHKSKNGYFINPFVELMMAYEVDNYLFHDLDLPLKSQRIVNLNGNITKTFQQHISSFDGLLFANRHFQIKNGFEIKAENRNFNQLNIETVAMLMDDSRTRDFTFKELSAIIKRFNFRTCDRHKAGVKTFLNELERYCSIERKKNNGTRFYRITLRSNYYL